jgi:hypothetical protein
MPALVRITAKCSRDVFGLISTVPTFAGLPKTYSPDKVHLIISFGIVSLILALWPPTLALKNAINTLNTNLAEIVPIFAVKLKNPVVPY